MRSDSDIERDSRMIRATVRLLAVALLLGLPACSSNSKSPSGTSTQSGTTGSTTGSVTPAMNEAQVRQDLKDHGYSNVSNLHKSGNDWAGSAVDATGKPVDFDVDQYGVIVIVP